MGSKRIDLKKMREQIARRKTSAEEKRKLLIENLSEEKFCEILDILPFGFEFKLSNISEDADGSWIKERIFPEKEYFRQNEPKSGRPWESHYGWHNLTNDRHCSSASLFSFKDKVVDAIYKEGAFSDYYKIQKKWQALYKAVLGENISNELTKGKLQELYCNQNKSLGDIGKEFGCSRQYIMKLMQKCGIERKTQSIASIEAIKKGKFDNLSYGDINEKFFGKWSPEMAWALGLLFTDGHISGNMVQFTSVDIDLLEKVKPLFQSSRPIQKRTQSYDKSKHIYAFAFSHPKIAEDLRKLGLHERKSLTMKFPDILEEYIRHFIRGCWDGDGSIFFDKNRLVASYISGSKKFIERLVQELYKIGISKSGVSYRIEKSGKRNILLPTEEMLSNHPDGRFPITIHMKNINAYYIKIQTIKNVEKLFHYFYDGVGESIYLTRKYKKFVEGLQGNQKDTEDYWSHDLPL